MLRPATNQALQIPTDGTSARWGSFSDSPYFIAANYGGNFKNIAGSIAKESLWKIADDGKGVQLIKELNNSFAFSSGEYKFQSLNNKTFFWQDNSQSNSFSPWVTDGTATGTIRLNGPTIGEGGNLGKIGKNIWWVDRSRSVTADGYAIWRSDGTQRGTTLVRNLSNTQPNTQPGRDLLTLSSRVKDSLIYSDRDSKSFYTHISNRTYIIDGKSNGKLWSVLDSESDPKAIDLSSKIPSIGKVFSSNGVLYLWGEGINGTSTIWKSDGTLAGTIKLGDFAGRSFYGKKLWDFEGIDQYYFYAKGSNGQVGLWTTKGEAASTQFLSPFTAGDDGTVLVFGNDRNGKSYLYGPGSEILETDGTIAGTRKIAAPVGLTYAPGRIGNDYGIDNIQGQLFGRQVVKGSTLTSGTTNFWSLSDLFNGRTQANLSIPASVSSNAPSNLTSVYDLNGKTYIASSGGLWQSDGTAEDTVLVSNHGVGAPQLVSYASSRPISYTILGENAIARYYTPEYGLELWRTDGTDAGTKLIVDLDTTPIEPQLQLGYFSKKGDWEVKDGTPNLELAYNSRTGEVGYFSTDGGASGSYQALYTVNDLDWKIVGVNDFDSKDVPNAAIYKDKSIYNAKDLLWRNSRSGEVAIWKIEAESRPTGNSSKIVRFIKDAFYLPTVAPSWEIQGIADFNSDGQLDLFWKDTNSGLTAFWQLNAGTFVSSKFSTTSGPGWNVQGLADFDGDGKIDILWRNDLTGQVALWKLDQTDFVSETILAIAPDLSWQIRGIADFDQDGQYDILWHQVSTDKVGYWKLDQLQFKSATLLDPATLPARLKVGEQDIVGISFNY